MHNDYGFFSLVQDDDYVHFERGGGDRLFAGIFLVFVMPNEDDVDFGWGGDDGPFVVPNIDFS